MTTDTRKAAEELALLLSGYSLDGNRIHIIEAALVAARDEEQKRCEQVIIDYFNRWPGIDDATEDLLTGIRSLKKGTTP